MDHYDGLCFLASAPEEIFESQKWIQCEQFDGTYLQAILYYTYLLYIPIYIYT